MLREGELDNDASLENLARTVVSYAKAGADVVAPSGMLDGFVGACRESLDEEQFDQVAIMAYSAKYASGYYGPFREAADSAPKFGDRRTRRARGIWCTHENDDAFATNDRLNLWKVSEREQREHALLGRIRDFHYTIRATRPLHTNQ